jgi:hypothetical protein
VSVDDIDQFELTGDVQTGGRSAKFPNDGLVGGGLRQAAHEVLGGAQILLPNDPRLAVHPGAFAQIPVGATANDFLGQAGHAQDIH